MQKLLGTIFLVAVAGCAGLPQAAPEPSPCTAGEASYACQVERYRNVSQ